MEFDSEPNVVISKDHDFIQLTGYTYTKVYNPGTKEFVSESVDPYKYICEHIMRGDKGDGIPNILSDDDTFVTDKRQKALTQVKIDALSQIPVNEWEDRKMALGWTRNQTLIDFRFIPEDVKSKILIQYKQQKSREGKKLFAYFSKYKLTKLLSKKDDF